MKPALAAIAVVALARAVSGMAASPPAAAGAPSAPAAAAAAQPEFGGQCAMAMAEGKTEPTDCSIRWVAPDGKVYCFSNEQSKKSFLEDPQGNIERARNFLAAGDVEATASRMEYYKSSDVDAFVTGVIKDTAAKHGGVFPFDDPVTGQQLKLVFDHVDFVRTLAGYGFFPDVAFNAQDNPDKHYLIDFWIKPAQDKLQIIETRIYKAPKQEGTGWKLQARQPIPWWWIPASEHPGKTEQTRGWEVMSAVEEDIMQRQARNNGRIKLTDAKTGEQLNLDFIGTHQPVRRLQKDGRYFMCTDFRKAGTTDQYYDIDFWVDEHDGKMTVDDVRVHKVPVKQQDGSWQQESRYNFDGMDFSIVP